MLSTLRNCVYLFESERGAKIVLIFYDVLIFISIARFISHFLLTYISPMRGRRRRKCSSLTMQLNCIHFFEFFIEATAHDDEGNFDREF